MKMFLIGIFDRKAQMFISLEPTPNINVSIRQLTENVNKPSESPLHKWPADYSLWELGTWDSETGQAIARPGEGLPGEPLNPWSFEKKLIIECESLKS